MNTLGLMNTDFPLAEGEEITDAPVYVHMANAFVDSLTLSGDLHTSCLAVQEIITEREEALGFINRYGSRSPTYSALELCPY
ncbi:MAG: hypothetical protein AAFN11_10815 [Chloroflexota bacterium]